MYSGVANIIIIFKLYDSRYMVIKNTAIGEANIVTRDQATAPAGNRPLSINQANNATREQKLQNGGREDGSCRIPK